MPNWHDPELLLKDHLAVIKLDHALGGLYLWEFVSTFDYEWSIITGKRSYSWTIYVYLVCRLSALAAWCVMFIGLDYSKRINCGAWESSFDGFAYLGLASASFIILLRNYAIWERNRYILAVSIGVWLVSIGLNIRGIIMSQSLWESVTSSCIEAHVQRSLANAIGILVSDIVLLVIMIVGLLRSRSASKDGLWRLLFSQGIIWLTLAGLVEVPPVVFMVLNLNDAWNLMFQPLEFIVLVIGATRMYRSLTDFDGDALLSTDISLSHPQRGSLACQETQLEFCGPSAYDDAPPEVHTNLDIDRGTVCSSEDRSLKERWEMEDNAQGFNHNSRNVGTK